MRKKILTILLVLTLAFIWIHSCIPRATSNQESASVMELLLPVLEFFLGKGNVTVHLVRKIAHFVEFFALGFELALLFPVELKWRLLAAGLSLIGGFLDETIQIFSDRGDQIRDVWLDFSGALCGILLATALLLLIRRIKRKKSGGSFFPEND